MHAYSLNKRQSGLESLPPLEVSYPTITVLEGNPRQSGRVDFGDATGPAVAGVWECTKGVFRITYPFSEIATILTGKIRVTDAAGKRVELGPGDSFFVSQGETLTWEIVENMRKSYFLFVDPAVVVRKAAE